MRLCGRESMLKRYRQIFRNMADDRIRNGLLVWRYRLTRPGRFPKQVVAKTFRIIEIVLERLALLKRTSE